MLSTTFTRLASRQSSKLVFKRLNSTKPSPTIVEADASNSLNKYYHKSGILLAVLTPAAFLVPASFVQPIDLSLGFLFTFHSHVAMNYVITDYIPKGSRSLARNLLLVASLVAAAGLFKLNLQGPGLTATVKNLWTQEKKDNKSDK